MPSRILNAYMSRMPALMAGENLRAVNTMAAATGSMEPSARKQYLRNLELVANDGTTPQRGNGVRKLRTPDDVASVLGGFGIDVEVSSRSAS